MEDKLATSKSALYDESKTLLVYVAPTEVYVGGDRGDRMEESGSNAIHVAFKVEVKCFQTIRRATREELVQSITRYHFSII